MTLVVKQPLIKFLADLAKLPVFCLIGVSIIETLGFDPVGDIAVGIQSLNAVMSTATGTNIILLIILNYIISNSRQQKEKKIMTEKEMLIDSNKSQFTTMLVIIAFTLALYFANNL